MVQKKGKVGPRKTLVRGRRVRGGCSGLPIEEEEEENEPKENIARYKFTLS